MSSVGVFRKVEMDLVFTLTQTDNPSSSGETLAIDSGGDELPLFFCPAARIKFLSFKPKNGDEDDDDEEYDDYDEDDIRPFNSSPHFPSTRSGDHQGESLLDCNRENICKLPVVPLYWCNNKEPNLFEFSCGACHESMASTSYYACLECEENFHKECVESPLEVKHPIHPFHSLQLYNHPESVRCFSCETSLWYMSYHCTTCDMSMHSTCAMKTIPIVIDHPRCHPHSLTFFPRQATLACNICGLIENLNPTYICTQCVFVVHRYCTGYPHVIRISRHHHRISFTSSLPPGELSCGVCRRLVDNNYGAYSCSKCDAYFVHSKCALHPNVWDGKELEGVPEEDDMIDDGEPFERIADGIILHLSHSHHLLLEVSKVYDDKKFCRGCTLPIYQGEFYSCMECDFILHDSCASAPRMKRHPLHPHPLTLNVATKGLDLIEGVFRCSACERVCSGFVYEHRLRGRSFQLDLRCATVKEPFEYEGHEHLLFLALDPDKKETCQMCNYGGSARSKLNCLECDYTICLCCATLPYKARYKHDSHFLTICDANEASDEPDWCEVCEGEIIEEDFGFSTRKEFQFYYQCNDCCTNLHVKCLLGEDIYMKPGRTVEDYISWPLGFNWPDVRILLNTSLSRPVCSECMRRCPFPTVFKQDNATFCSWDCIPGSTWKTM